MSFEQMVLILAGKSKVVIAEVEKSLKPYVTGTIKNRQK